jgi:hypothetical protein
MSAQDLVELIEELVEIKVRQHAATLTKGSGHASRELARVIFETNVADRDRLKSIKQTLAQTFEGT